jgi:hypothetical protein
MGCKSGFDSQQWKEGFLFLDTPARLAVGHLSLLPDDRGLHGSGSGNFGLLACDAV